MNEPDIAREATDKSVSHFHLKKFGVPVPYTVIIRKWEPKNFNLTAEEKKELGIPFIIKPANGFGRQGVVENVTGSMKNTIKARKFDSNDNFLLQKKIKPIRFKGKKAWFRVFYLFGEIIPCWWDPKTKIYDHVTSEQITEFNLIKLLKITNDIAKITEMEWFSTEIAVKEKRKKENAFVVVDYVNDQCDMTVKSRAFDGVPDDTVEHTAKRLVAVAWRYKKKYPMPIHPSFWLF